MSIDTKFEYEANINMYVPNQHSQRLHHVYSIRLHIEGTLRKLYSTKLLAQVRQHFISLYNL